MSARSCVAPTGLHFPRDPRSRWPGRPSMEDDDGFFVPPGPCRSPVPVLRPDKVVGAHAVKVRIDTDGEGNDAGEADPAVSPGCSFENILYKIVLNKAIHKYHIAILEDTSGLIGTVNSLLVAPLLSVSVIPTHEWRILK